MSECRWPPEKAWWYPDGVWISPQEAIRSNICTCREVQPGVLQVCPRCRAILNAEDPSEEAKRRTPAKRLPHQREPAEVARS